MKKISTKNLNREKNILWQKKLKYLEKVVDGLGRRMDKNIMETVTAFNLSNIPTSSSCGGHLKRLSYPYVMGEPEGEPKFRWRGEGRLIKSILEKYGLKQRRDIFGNKEAETEYYRRIDEDLHNQETPEYRKWYKNVKPLRADMSALIDEFYQSRQTPENKKLCLVDVYSTYRVESGLGNTKANKGLTLNEIKSRIVMARGEFEAFTKFLKGGYFST